MKFIDLYDEMEKTAISAKLVDRAVGARLNRIDKMTSPIMKATEQKRTATQLDRMYNSAVDGGKLQRKIMNGGELERVPGTFINKAENRKPLYTAMEHSEYQKRLADDMRKTVDSVKDVHGFKRLLGEYTITPVGNLKEYVNNAKRVRIYKGQLAEGMPTKELEAWKMSEIARSAAGNKELRPKIKRSAEHVKKLKSDAASYAMEQEARAAAEKAAAPPPADVVSKKLLIASGYNTSNLKKLYEHVGGYPSVLKEVPRVPEEVVMQAQTVTKQDRPKGFLSRLFNRG